MHPHWDEVPFKQQAVSQSSLVSKRQESTYQHIKPESNQIGSKIYSTSSQRQLAQVVTDNMIVLYYLNKQGGTHSMKLRVEAKSL